MHRVRVVRMQGLLHSQGAGKLSEGGSVQGERNVRHLLTGCDAKIANKYVWHVRNLDQPWSEMCCWATWTGPICWRDLRLTESQPAQVARRGAMQLWQQQWTAALFLTTSRPHLHTCLRLQPVLENQQLLWQKPGASLITRTPELPRNVVPGCFVVNSLYLIRAYNGSHCVTRPDFLFNDPLPALHLSSDVNFCLTAPYFPNHNSDCMIFHILRILLNSDTADDIDLS